MGNGVECCTRLKSKKNHQKQKYRRDRVKSIIAAYVSGKVPLSKMMNPSRLTAPKNRSFERSVDPPKVTTSSTVAVTSRHKRRDCMDSATTGTSLGEQQKEVVARRREPDKLWPGRRPRDKCGDILEASGKDDDDNESSAQDLQTCSSCSKTFISDGCSKGGSTASSLKSLSRGLKLDATLDLTFAAATTVGSTFTKGAIAALEAPANGSAPAVRTCQSEQTTRLEELGSTSSKKCSGALVTGNSDRIIPKLFDSYPFDYDSFAHYLTKKCSPSRRSVGPSLRWRTTSASFSERQNLLELIKSHENVEQCLVKQIVHLRRERDKYRHAYIDLVKLHKILANRWFQFKKLNID